MLNDFIALLILTNRLLNKRVATCVPEELKNYIKKSLGFMNIEFRALINLFARIGLQHNDTRRYDTKIGSLTENVEPLPSPSLFASMVPL